MIWKNTFIFIQKNKYSIIFFTAILFLLLKISLFRSADMGDEGLILSGTENILSSKIIFKDFFSLVPPGIYYLLGLFWKIFGKDYIVSRLLLIISTWLICIFIYLTSRAILNKIWSMLNVLIFVLFFYPVQMILSFHWLSLLFILIAVWQINKYLLDQKNKHLLLSGVNLGISIFILHTKPALITLCLAFFILWHSKKTETWNKAIKKILILSLSALISFGMLILPFIIKSGWSNIYEGLILSLHYYTKLGGIAPFYTKSLFYLIIINYLSIAYILYKKKLFTDQTRLYFFISSITLISTIYRFDYHHVAYIYNIFTLPLSFYAIKHLNFKTNQLKLYAPLLLILPLFEYYLLITSIDSKLGYVNKNNWHALDTKIGQIYFNEYNLKREQAILNTLAQISDKEIFIYPFSSQYYTLSGKKNPTRYEIIYDSYLSEKAKNEIKNNLLNKQVKYLLYIPLENPIVGTEQNFLADFIKTYYTEDKIPYKGIDAYFYLYTKK